MLSTQERAREIAAGLRPNVRKALSEILPAYGDRPAGAVIGTLPALYAARKQGLVGKIVKTSHYTRYAIPTDLGRAVAAVLEADNA